MLAAEAGLDLAARPRATSPGPSCTTRPTSSACCLAGPPAAVGLRPQRAPAGRAPGGARPSTCSATIRRSCCGAATTSRSRSTSRRRGADRRRCSPLRRRPGAADVEPHDPRPLGEAGARTGRREPSGHRPLRRAPAPPKLDGTDSHLYFGWYHGDERDLPGFAAAVPRMVRFVGRVRRAGRARRRRFHGARALARPRLGAARPATTPSSRTIFDARVPPPSSATFDDGGERPRRTRPRLIKHHDRDAAPAQVPADRRLLPVQPGRRPDRRSGWACSTTSGRPSSATRRSPKPAGR